MKDINKVEMKKKNIFIKKSFFVYLIILNILFLNTGNYCYGLENDNLEKANVELVFNEKSFLPNEELTLQIELFNVNKLYEIDILIDISDDYEVILNNKANQYFYFSALSIFDEEPVINDFIDNKYLRLKMVKSNNIDEGYHTAYKNNLCYLNLKSKIKVNNVFDDFLNRINIKMYDKNKNIIESNIATSELIKYTWNIDNYEIGVYENIPEFKDDIKILNRNEFEYDIEITNNIDNSKIGKYIVTLLIYDHINHLKIEERKSLIVNDTINPTIEVKKENNIIDNYVYIEDSELLAFDFTNLFILNDNYDNNLNLEIIYDNNLTHQAFINLLFEQKSADITAFCYDSSHNKSNEIKLTISVIDKTAPSIIVNDDLKYNLNEKFEIKNYFQVEDNFDSNPKYSINYLDLDKNIIYDIDNYLLKGEDFYIKIIPFDDSNNYGMEKIIKINVIDNIKPIVINSDYVINDNEIKNLNLNDIIEYSDNIKENISLDILIYQNNELVEKITNNQYFITDEINNRFQDILIKYRSIDYKCLVTDKFSNITTSNIKRIDLIDKTPPIIKIEGIENNKKYNDIKNIKILVTDNVTKNVNTKVYVNDVYIENINEIDLEAGKYQLLIISEDDNFNQNKMLINFEITNNSLENQKLEEEVLNINNLSIYFLIFLILLSLIIIIIRIIKYYKFKNNEI